MCEKGDGSVPSCGGGPFKGNPPLKMLFDLGFGVI